MLKVKKSEKPEVISNKHTFSKPMATPGSTPRSTPLKAPEEITIDPLEEEATMSMGGSRTVGDDMSTRDKKPKLQRKLKEKHRAMRCESGGATNKTFFSIY